MIKKYVNNKMVITAFLAVMLLISSSSLSADFKKISEITDKETPIVARDVGKISIITKNYCSL